MQNYLYLHSSHLTINEKEGDGAYESKDLEYSLDIMTQIKKLQDLLYFKGTINQCSVMLKNLEDNDLDISLKISVSILNY